MVAYKYQQTSVVLSSTFVVSINQLVSIYNRNHFTEDNSETEIDLSIPQVFPKEFTRGKLCWTTKISFDALDLRSDGGLASVKTKQSHARNA